MTQKAADLAREYVAQMIETQRRLGSDDLLPDATGTALRSVLDAFESLVPEDRLIQTG